jgi:hypothetical protein
MTKVKASYYAKLTAAAEARVTPDGFNARRSVFA